jgi:hypothetical protein
MFFMFFPLKPPYSGDFQLVTFDCWGLYGFPMVFPCFPLKRHGLHPAISRELPPGVRQVDEEWFFKTHIVIEAEGSHVVPSQQNTLW